jgi:hypothetical protein
MSKINLRDDLTAEAINDYANSGLRVIEIAQKHKISVSLLSSLVEAFGVPRRHRGRPPLAHPSARSQQVLAYAAIHGFSKAAKHFGISRQLVSSTAKRWGVLPPRRTDGQRSPISDLQLKNRERKPRRDVLVCFRLRERELALLRTLLPESVTQSTRSAHKLVRAAILERLENSKFCCASPPTPPLHSSISMNRNSVSSTQS